jgi:hypothetical protein
MTSDRFYLQAARGQILDQQESASKRTAAASQRAGFTEDPSTFSNAQTKSFALFTGQD